MTKQERKQKHKIEMVERRNRQNARRSLSLAIPQKEHAHTQENARRLRQIASGMLRP
jgi:hypothetical protein